jgi:hypothetical protein
MRSRAANVSGVAVSRRLRTRDRLRRIVLGTPASIAGTVYGTIVVMGAVTAGSQDAREPGRLAAVVVATVVVLWVAHVYAHGLGEAIGRGRRLDRDEFVSVARRELAIPMAAVTPTAALAFGGIGLLRDATAVWLALAIGLATLAVQGFRYAGLERLSRLGTAASVGMNVGLGLVIVALKVFLAH